MPKRKLPTAMEAHRWKPGQSGNPGGRPRKRPISDRYQERAEMPLDEDLRILLKLPEGATYGDAVAIAQYRAAIKGRPDAAREIREAIEGKIPPAPPNVPLEEINVRVEFVGKRHLPDEEQKLIETTAEKV
jgi:hypothetical protein